MPSNNPKVMTRLNPHEFVVLERLAKRKGVSTYIYLQTIIKTHIQSAEGVADGE